MGKEANEVKKTLKKDGTQIILIPHSTGSGRYNPATGGLNKSTASDQEIRIGVLLDSLRRYQSIQFGQTDNINTEVEGAEKWLMLDAVGREPKVRDRVNAAGTVYSIINSQVISKGEPVLYILALKR